MLLKTDEDLLAVESKIIPLMKEYINNKELGHETSTVIVESWIQSLLQLALLGELAYLNAARYTYLILDDAEKCKFFTEPRNRKEILKFLKEIIL